MRGAQTTYHCLRIEEDPQRESGRVLVLDGRRHSYVDLADPTYLDFDHVQAIASVIDTAYRQDEPVRA